MIRRAHVPQLRSGPMMLGGAQAHHVRGVLRLGVGDPLELFDDAGSTAQVRIIECRGQSVRVQVNEIRRRHDNPMQLTIASAIPKGARADWMVEKLSELGVERFAPLLAERSVVAPQGSNKMQRWVRLAKEAARQSQRSGVMQIAEPCELPSFLRKCGEEAAAMLHLSTIPDAPPLGAEPAQTPLVILVGPEGGWTDGEIKLFDEAHVRAVRLTPTILRTETAAVAAAAVVMCKPITCK